MSLKGYCVIQHPDPEESGIYPVNNGQQNKSFAFMSEHSHLFCLTPDADAATIRQDVGIREVALKTVTCIQS